MARQRCGENASSVGIARHLAGRGAGGVQRELTGVHIHSGLASASRDLPTHSARQRQFEAWRKLSPCVEVHPRSLAYRGPRDRVIAVEKGIDVAIAIGMVRRVLIEEGCDIGILVSADTDLLPALELIVERRGVAAVEVAMWSAPTWPVKPLGLAGHKVRQHALDEKVYRRSEDRHSERVPVPEHEQAVHRPPVPPPARRDGDVEGAQPLDQERNYTSSRMTPTAVDRAITRAFEGPEARRSLPDGATSWVEGGCWTAATGLHRWLGDGDYVGVFVTEPDVMATLLHVVLRRQDWYLDAEGVHTDHHLVLDWTERADVPIVGSAWLHPVTERAMHAFVLVSPDRAPDDLAAVLGEHLDARVAREFLDRARATADEVPSPPARGVSPR